MKQYTFKDGIKVIASSAQEAKSKHKVMACAPAPKKSSKGYMFPETKKLIRDTKKEADETLKSLGLENDISVTVYRSGSLDTNLSDSFDIKYKNTPLTIDELYHSHKSIAEMKEYLTKNKSKIIELVKCAHRVEELVEELGLKG